MSPQWVRQEDDWGCAIAVMAMVLGITYQSAWFLAHRIRYAMTQEPLFSKLSGTVEADETYVGGKSKNMHKSVFKMA